MAAPSVLQERNLEDVSLSSTFSDLSGAAGSFDSNVTAGSTILVIVMQIASSLRTYEVQDDIDGAYTTGPQTYDGDAGARQTAMFYLTGVTGGATTVSVRCTSGTVSPKVKVFEISATAETPITSSLAGTTADITSNAYPCSASSAVIDTTTDALIVSALITDANAGGFTAKSGWTLGEGGGTQWACQYKQFTGATANERGELSDTSTDRDFAGVIIAFETSGGAPASTILPFMMAYH